MKQFCAFPLLIGCQERTMSVPCSFSKPTPETGRARLDLTLLSVCLATFTLLSSRNEGWSTAI